MSRKINRVEYHLDSKGIKELPYEEIAAILRGTDPLIMSGGRNLLSKLLKGSKEKKIIELGLDKIPSYGYYSDVSIEDLLAKIDWSIKQFSESKSGAVHNWNFIYLPLCLNWSPFRRIY